MTSFPEIVETLAATSMIPLSGIVIGVFGRGGGVRRIGKECSRSLS